MQKGQRKKVWDYTIILIVFAVTGSTAAYFPKFIMPWTGLECCNFWYILAYIALITPIYQVLLLIYAFIFGKFNYFLDKQKKIWRWMKGLFTGKKESVTEESKG